MPRRLLILQRLALNIRFNKGFIGILCLWSLFLCLACSENHSCEKADELNSFSYACHYKDLDSTYFFARKAFEASINYSAGKAEALNNVAFVSIAKMHYDLAKRQLDSVFSITDNQIELLVADVQMMRLCQRKAQNKDFYEYKEQATQRFKRINEERSSLTGHETQRLLYAETEFGIVASTYYYYVGLYDQAVSSLNSIPKEGLMQKDTAQYVNLLYQYGSGGMLKGKDRRKVIQQEYEMLLECYLISCKKGYKYWEANSMQGLSEHLMLSDNREFIISNNNVSIRFLNVAEMPDSLLAGYLSQRSMQIFKDYGDVYQISGSLRTLANCFWEIGDSQSALICLKDALADKLIWQAPDLVASIREQLSIVYSSLDDKLNSDLNRNSYLDLQERTRQDMELDARASKLQQTSKTLNVMMLVILALILALVALIYFLIHKRAFKENSTRAFDEALAGFKRRNMQHVRKLEENNEVLEEELNVAQISLEDNKRRNIDDRAKVFLVDSVMPLIDRMAHELSLLKEREETEDVKSKRIEYISELSATIEQYNHLLTEWIQLRKGEINLNISSFRIQELFDIVGRSKTIFAMQGIELHVEDTAVSVKADKVLTLFMINTIADNARKFCHPGGHVQIYASEQADCVEISVKDDGAGMTDEQLSDVFDRKVSNGHGFGLMNCKGILEKYRKFSSIFSVCAMSAESRAGKGSRFYFRLPKGIATLLLSFLVATPSFAAAYPGKKTAVTNDRCLREAAAFADSAYFSNVNGTYRRTFDFADSTICCLNRHYKHTYRDGKLLLKFQNESSAYEPELEWFKRGLKTNYDVILDIRNESAIAALALHDWDVYRYNNSVYTKLFKEVYSDKSLSAYCRIMQRSEANKNIAIVLLVLLLATLIALAYMLYYRGAIRRSAITELRQQLLSIMEDSNDAGVKLQKVQELSAMRFADNLKDEIRIVAEELESITARKQILDNENSRLSDALKKTRHESDSLHISNNIMENCLSTIKHETMYYPSRIRNFISESFPSCGCGISDDKQFVENINEMASLVGFYKELYSILCRQAHRQTQMASFMFRPLTVSKYLGGIGVSTVGDTDLLSYLFLIIKRQNHGIQPEYSLISENGRYVRLVTNIDNCSQNGDCDIFAPRKENIPYLVCRQIIREISAATNLCGCGISASAADDAGRKIRLAVVLPCHDGNK